jgi:iron-sulfur cluster repair protein YtfE (RIC family)
MPDSPTPRVLAFGAELVAVHDELRSRLQRLRTAPHSAGSGLREHCAAFCRALATHHTSEDARAFPLLAREAPELAPVIAKLEEDHVLIAGLLQQIEELVDRLPDAPTPDERLRFERELDGIAAIMESHFSFEERRILDALDRLDPGVHSSVELFGMAPPGEH